MKGLSVVVAIALLVLAHHLATRMKRDGVLPTELSGVPPPMGLTSRG